MSDEHPVPRTARFEPLGALWRLLAAPQTLMALLAVLALLLAVEALISWPFPQAGPETGGLDLGAGFGLAVAQFDLYHSFWFQALLGVVGLCFFVRLVQSTELAWRAWGEGHWRASSLALWGTAASQATVALSGPPPQAQDQLRRILDQAGYRWSEVPGTAWPNAVVGRRLWVLWLRPLIWSALIASLVGLAILSNWGWQGEEWQPDPGDSREVIQDGPVAVRLESFELQQDQAGHLVGAESQVAWLEEGVVVRSATISAGRPATYEGLSVHQVGYVPLVRLQAWDQEERLLTLQAAGNELVMPGEIDVVFASPQAQPLVLIPGQDRFLALAYEPPCAGQEASLVVSVAPNGGGEGHLLGHLYQSGTLDAEGLRLEIDLGYRPVLRVDRRPGLGLALAGAAMALLGLALLWLLPAQVAWLAVGPAEEEASVARLLAPAGAQGRRWLLNLAGRLEQEVSRGA